MPGDRSTDPVMYVFLRRDLNMPPGKAAAQACHAVHQIVNTLSVMVEDAELPDKGEVNFLEWEGGSYAKVVLGLKDRADRDRLVARLDREKILYHAVVDEGRTVVAPGSETAIALQPLDRETARLLFSEYRLY